MTIKPWHPSTCRSCLTIFEILLYFPRYFSDNSTVTVVLKQGPVLSPLLFDVYYEELLLTSKSQEVGCHYNNTFCRVFIYAKDMTLLAPTGIRFSVEDIMCLC